MTDAGARDDQPHGRLGRLFAALVGNEDELASVGLGGAGAGAGDGDGETGLDLEALSRSLVGAPDPVGTLRALVADVRRHAAAAEGDGSSGAPSAFELYLAERLGEAGIERDDVALPMVSVVRPRTSGLFYLRVMDESLPWLARLRVLRTEAALNCALLVEHALPDANRASLEEIVRCEQRVCRSIVSQASRAAARLDGAAYGEWAVRSAISSGIECLRLPHRLTARFRTNVAAGTAAIEVDLVPPAAWSATAYVDALGVVPATAEMRRRAATDYNLRLGVLLAAYALMVAPQLDEVWVAGVVDDPARHACYYSARLTRDLVEGLDLEGPLDPLAVMRAAGAELSEAGRTLSPVRQTFSLEQERFCPARRHDPVELSDAALRPVAAAGLGCRRVRELAVDEACGRRRAASELTRSLGGSTEANVRALLAAADGAAPDVRDAALRCVRELVDGTLADDPEAIAEALVSGDALSRASARARELLLSQDAEGARRVAEGALAPLDAAGTYVDAGDGLVWRAFGSYTERALYNCLLAAPGERCELVPAAYVEVLLAASAAELALGRADEATSRARRACELAPLSSRAGLHLAQCLEASGDGEAAAAELCRTLSLAHDPESIGIAYLRMAQLQWGEGRVLAAQACYQRACRLLPAPALVAGLAVVAIVGQVGVASDGSLDDDEAEAALRGASIPCAPTPEVGEALLGATRAAVDEELFGPARDLMHALCLLFRDDVSFGVLRSLEAEPDR